MVVPYLSLVRPINLGIIVITQILIRYGIIEPIVQLNGITLQVKDFHYFLFVVATVLIAAGGYVINDIMDVAIDKINKPNRVFVTNTISIKSANNYFIALYSTGMTIALFASYLVGVTSFTFLFGLCALLLYYYSTELKKKLLVGNLVVAFCIGMVPIIVGLIDITMINKAFQMQPQIFYEDIEQFQIVIKTALKWVFAFGLFAFWISIAREITKDIADAIGDKQFGANTLPIKLGIKTTSKITALFYFPMILGLLGLAHFATNYIVLKFYLYFLLVSLVYLALQTWSITTIKNAKYCSNLNKIISIAGIMYAFLIGITLKYWI